MKLKKEYKKVCNKYVKAFRKYMGFDDSEMIDSVGGNYDFNSCWVFYFGDIVEIVNKNYPVNIILHWYDFIMDNQRKLVKISAYVEMYQDYEYKSGFAFYVTDFHTELLKKLN